MNYCQLRRKSWAGNVLPIKVLASQDASSVYAQCLNGLQSTLLDCPRFLLTTAEYCSTVILRGWHMTIKETIQEELRRREWSHYRLVNELKGKLPARTVYAYLSGGCDLGSESASVILEALGLQVTRKKSGRSRRKEV
jgi:hypothetical protein